jgi:hypothetical protein
VFGSNSVLRGMFMKLDRFDRPRAETIWLLPTVAPQVLET